LPTVPFSFYLSATGDITYRLNVNLVTQVYSILMYLQLHDKWFFIKN